MMRALVIAGLMLLAPVARASDECQGLVGLTELPQDFKTISEAAVGPVPLTMKSNGHCTCNDTPAVQRRLGQQEPAGVNWACYAADAEDSKGK